MNRRIILHKDLAWLPTSWDRFFKNFDIRMLCEAFLNYAFISSHHYAIRSTSNLDCTLDHDAYVLALLIGLNHLFIPLLYGCTKDLDSMTSRSSF